jgi:hypothetical protein
MTLTIIGWLVWLVYASWCFSIGYAIGAWLDFRSGKDVK